jgi:hypothetical protein
MTPISGRRVLRHPRPWTAEFSLRHVSGFVIGKCRSPNLTVNNAFLKALRSNCTTIRSREPLVSVARALAWCRMAATALLYARVSVPSPVEPGPLARTHVCHVFSLTSCRARDPRGLLTS